MKREFSIVVIVLFVIVLSIYSVSAFSLFDWFKKLIGYSDNGNVYYSPYGYGYGYGNMCYDSDRGINLTIRGYITASNFPSQTWDYCYNRSLIREYYCTDNYNGIMVNRNCPVDYYCSNGACIKEANSGYGQILCNDSDKGRNYTLNGTVIVGSNRYSDRCINERILDEQYCLNNARRNETVNCPANTICSGGKCINNNNRPIPIPRRLNKFYCIDSDNGVEYNIAGNVTIIFDYGSYNITRLFEDHCNGRSVIEYSCNGSYSLSDVHRCDVDCYGGRCISNARINAPSSLSARFVSERGVELSWSDNSNNEEKFVVYRATSLLSPWLIIAVLPANSVSYLDSNAGLASYYYTVAAYNGNLGYSESSDFIEVNTIELSQRRLSINSVRDDKGNLQLTWGEVAV